MAQSKPFMTLTEYQARALVSWAIANAAYQMGSGGSPAYEMALKVARQLLVTWKEIKR